MLDIKALLRVILGLSDEGNPSMPCSNSVPSNIVHSLGKVFNTKARVVDQWEALEILLLETYTPVTKKGYRASLKTKIKHLAVLARNLIKLEGIKSSINIQLMQYDRTDRVDDAEELRDGLQEVIEQIEAMTGEMGGLYELIKKEKLYIGLPPGLAWSCL